VYAAGRLELSPDDKEPQLIVQVSLAIAPTT
jgi:hypothetical protein